ncbi:MAG: hypothetical protein HY062_11935 [Bacteroidetes bacterium]|nr:hypothetical protein [Bacteroidota bacterium]
MKENDEDYEKYYEQARLLQHQYRDYDHLREILIKKGADHLMASEIITQLKKVNYAKRRSTGTQIIAFGAVLLLIGFIITCLCFNFNMPIHTVMYTFTSAGLLTLFIGLFYIFN